MIKEFRMKEMLLATVCVVGMGGVASAQLAGSLNVEGIYERGNGGFGGNAGLLLPLFSSPVGMFYTMLEGGWRQGFNHGGSPAGSLGFGYRWLPAGFDGVGIGLNGSFDVSRTRNRNSFYGTTAGLEIFIPGGLSIGLNGYIPLFDKEKKAGTSSGQTPGVVLHDQTPGSCNPSNPTRVCIPVLEGQLVNSTERNRWSADVQVAYRLPFFELIDITPNVSVYMMDRQGKQLKGIDGGLDVALPLAGGVQLTMSAHGRHDREIGTIEEFGVGLRINLGPAAVVSDARQRMLAQPPRRLALQDRVRPEVQTTVTTLSEALKWDKTDATVSELRFVNSGNQTHAVSQASDLANGGILIVDGDVALGAGETITISGLNKGMVGGGTSLTFQGVNSGTTVHYTAPGTRGKISQADPSVPVLVVNTANNISLSHFDLQGGNGLIIQDAVKLTAEDMKVSGGSINGIGVISSQDITLKQITIEDTRRGLQFLDAHQVLVENVNISLTGPGAVGVIVGDNSDQVTFKNLHLEGNHEPLSRAFISQFNNFGQIFVQNIQMQNFTVGFLLDDQTVITDLTHDHQATNVLNLCDLNPDAVGEVDVFNNTTMTPEVCQ